MKMKLTVAVMLLLCFCSLASTPVFAQSPPRHAVGRNTKMIAMHRSLMTLAQSVCSTDECAKLIDEGPKLTSDAETKLIQGTMTAEDAKQFHAALKAHIRALRTAILNSLPPAEAEKLNKTMPLPPDEAEKPKNLMPLRFAHPQAGSLQCNLCDQVYTRSVAICGLYLLYSPVAGAVCISVATFAYINCTDTYCYQPDGGGGGGDDPNGCDDGDDGHGCDTY